MLRSWVEKESIELPENITGHHDDEGEKQALFKTDPKASNSGKVFCVDKFLKLRLDEVHEVSRGARSTSNPPTHPSD